MIRRGGYTVLGGDHYSYDTAILTRLADGRTVGNITKYSPTTSKHQNDDHAGVRFADVKLDNVPRGTTASELVEHALVALAGHPDG